MNCCRCFGWVKDRLPFVFANLNTRSGLNIAISKNGENGERRRCRDHKRVEDLRWEIYDEQILE